MMIGQTCEKCGVGKYRPYGPHGWEEIDKGLIARTYDYVIKCDNDECGQEVSGVGSQTRQGSSIRKKQGMPP